MRLFLSGLLRPVNIDRLIEWGNPNLLVSTVDFMTPSFTVRQPMVDLIEKAHDAGMLLMLDSGAAPIMAAAGATGGGYVGGGGDVSRAALNDLDRYFEEYLRFVRRHHHLFQWGVVELDLQTIVGQEKVLRWRQALADIVGKKRLWVVHHVEPFSAFAEWPSSGIGWAGLKQDTDSVARRLRAAGHRVHGFTSVPFRLQEARLSPFASVDSTSWGGGKYGLLYRFDGRQMVHYKVAENEVPATLWEQVLTFTGTQREDWAGRAHPSADFWNLHEWVKYSLAIEEARVRGGAPKGNRNALKTGAYAKNLPPLTCGRCPWREVCPEASEDDDHLCAYNKAVKKAAKKLRKIGRDPRHSYSTMVQYIIEKCADLEERLGRVTIAEIFSETGGYPDKARLRLMAELRQWVTLLSQLTATQVTTLSPPGDDDGNDTEIVMRFKTYYGEEL